MAYSTRFRSTDLFGSGAFPPGVKWLLITNIGIYLLYFVLAAFRLETLFHPLGLIPEDVLHGAIWQLVTYQFLHDPYSFMHILFNMLSLWMFGRTLESDWGTKRFLQYYFLCGIGAGLCVVAVNTLMGYGASRTIGASGAIYGLLLAFGMMYPRATIIFFIFPIEARWLVIIFGAWALLGSLMGGGGVSNIAHLGGMIAGYVYLKSGLMSRRAGVYAGYGGAARSYRPSLTERLRQRYKQWKLERAKRKFEVYLRKRQQREKDSDRFVH